MNKPPAPGEVRYIVVDRDSRETLCITLSYEEAVRVWQEEIGYSTEIHAVPASSKMVYLGKGTKIADPGVRLPLRAFSPDILPPSMVK